MRKYKLGIPLKTNRNVEKLIRDLGGPLLDHSDDDVVAMTYHAQLGMNITNNKVRKVCNVGYHRVASIMIELADMDVIEKLEGKPPMLNYCHL